MDPIQPKSLWFDIKLSESVVFTPPTGVGIYALKSDERHFQGRISPSQRLETVRDLLKYIQREFQITSPICLYTRPNGNTSKNSESVNTLPKHSTLLIGLPKTSKQISTPNSSLQVPFLNCSVSAISTELNASTNTTVNSVDPDTIVRNESTSMAPGLADLDSDVDDTIISNTYQDDDDDEILETATMRKPVFSATTMSFADWEFLDVQRRLKSFMYEANIGGRQKLKAWFVEFYKTFERKRSAIASERAESRVPFSPVDTNENEIETSLVSETILSDPASQIARTVAEATSAFPLIANKPADNSDSESLINDTDFSSGSDLDDSSSSTDKEYEAEVSGSDWEEASFYGNTNTSTSLSDISETLADTPQSGVQFSNSNFVRRSERVTSGRSNSLNVASEIAKRAGKQPQTPSTSKAKASTTKAKLFHSCSYPLCNFRARYLYQFRKHLDEVHFETPFKCDKCGRKYRVQGSFYNHLKTHREKKHVCPFQNCSYKSVYSSSIKTHIMRHRGEKPFACKVCKYKSSTISDLNAHMMIHTGIKPFACTQCKYRCFRKRVLRSHVNKRHGVKN